MLNFAPIHFEDAEIIVGVAPYKDKNYLRSLRKKYSDTHLFHRERSQILSLALVPEAESIGETSETIKLSDSLYLCASLVRNALINFLYRLDRRILEYDPIEFVANPAKENLLAKVLPSELESPDWLSDCPRYVAAIRTVSVLSQNISKELAVRIGTVLAIVVLLFLIFLRLISLLPRFLHDTIILC